jgi:hypothetical protein
MTTLLENVLKPAVLKVPVNVALPDVSNVRELLEITSFVVVL